MFNFEVCAYLFEIKSKIPDFERGKAIRLRRINRKNTLSISRIALKVSADASLRVTKVPKFRPVEAKRRSSSSGTQISGKRGCFEIGSKIKQFFTARQFQLDT